MEDRPKRPRGRPPAPEAERRRVNVTLRLRNQTKEALERAANQNGRSLSEESEQRPDASVRSEGTAEEMLDFAYGRPLAGILILAARVMRETGASAGFTSTHSLAGAANWPSDPYAFDQAVRAVIAVLETLRPDGEIKVPSIRGVSALFAGMHERLGIGFASSALSAVAGEELTADLAEWGERVRKRLGPDAVERIKKKLGPA